MSCLEKTEYVESLRKGTSDNEIFPVTWQSIFRDAWEGGGQSNHQCQIVSMGESDPRYRARKKRRLHTQKVRIHIQIRSVDLQWSYISCNRRCTNFVFRRIIYLLEQRSNIWPGESKSALISLSAGLPKMSGWTPSLVSHPFPLTNGSDLSLRALPEGKPWVSQSKKSSNLFQSEM